MPRYEVRLESPDLVRDNGDPHFRLTRLTAADEDQARGICERMEYGRAAYTMTPDELERVEAIEADPDEVLAGADKGRLYTHRQERPYEVVSVTEVATRGED